MAAYENMPAGEMRRMLAAGTFVLKGDADRMAQAMMACAGRNPAPRRLTLGSDAYVRVQAALRDRLAALEAQREIAWSTDTDA